MILPHEHGKETDMKLNPNFIAREIAGELVIVPIGDALSEKVGLIATNELGALIWKSIENGLEREDILAKILDEFDVDCDTAETDLDEFLDKLRDIGAICR